MKLWLGKSLSHMDVGSLFVPLGETVGTTNAVMFGVVLMHYRDAELNVYPNRPPPQGLVNHDHDAPAWWHYRKKDMLYADGFAPKSHRALMPFLMVKQNGPDKFREWEEDFRHIEAYLQSLWPPQYNGAVDQPLANDGKKVFNVTCARCHGTYGENSKWPGKVVPIDEVGTDSVRLTGLSTTHRRNWGRSWFGFYGAPRATGDLDLWIDPVPENARRAWTALEEFGAPLFDLTLGDLSTPGVVFQMGVPPFRIDVATSLTGIEFDDGWREHGVLRVAGLEVPIMSRAALIANKRATARPKDLLDLELLGERSAER